jgi:hypothetical protein
LARSLAEQPLECSEDHFPTRLVTDIRFIDDSPPAARPVHEGGRAAGPGISFVAGDGILADHVPEDENPVMLPDCRHLDVLTAVPRQNGGTGSKPLTVRRRSHAPGPGSAAAPYVRNENARKRFVTSPRRPQGTNRGQWDTEKRM